VAALRKYLTCEEVKFREPASFPGAWLTFKVQDEGVLLLHFVCIPMQAELFCGKTLCTSAAESDESTPPEKAMILEPLLVPRLETLASSKSIIAPVVAIIATRLIFIPVSSSYD